MNSDDLRERRKALGLTQKRLAELLGVPLRTYAGWEIGETIKIPRLVDGALRDVEAADQAGRPV
jgi:transcriptional regulator with XRE-family HTH domain